MSMIIGLGWGVIAALEFFWVTKYYLPVLLQRSEEKSTIETVSLQRIDYVLAISSVVFSVACGYYATENCSTWFNLCKIAITFFILNCIWLTDLKLMIIPNICSLILLGAGICILVIEFVLNRQNAMSWLINDAISLLITFILLVFMSRITKGGIGMGDIKIFCSLAFVCGIRGVFCTLLMAFSLCAVFSILLILIRRKSIKDNLPLGPFILMGYGVSVILAII